MAKSLTASTAIIMLSIPDLFNTPQQIQGFAADDVFSTDALESAETMMGVDGNLSGGFVYVSVKQKFMLMADSDSIEFFDQWWAAMQSQEAALTANGNITLTSVGKKWTMTKGFLKSYTVIPDAKKLLGARSFTIEWQSAIPQPV